MSGTNSARRAFLQASLGTALHSGASGASMTEGRETKAARGVVAADPQDSARAGAKLFASGGNAMDAAAAACLASCVLEVSATDIGGYVFAAVALEGKSGRVWSLDSNSTAPTGASPNMYDVEPAGAGKRGINENEYQCSVPGNVNIFGPLAVGVPGVMAGVGTLWERWGRAKWQQVLTPARELLDKGFPYGHVAAAARTREAEIRRFEPTLRHLMPEGRLPRADEIWRRPDFEKTLARIASAGWRDFYEGDLGRRIADYVRSGGGILSRTDMKAFRPRLTEPYETSYRGAKVYSSILANGGLSVAQALNMLDLLDPAPDTDARYWHRLAEVLKLVWRDRLRYLGDPDQAQVPVRRLLSAEYAAGRVETLRTYPDSVDRRSFHPARQAKGTIHISTADTEGNLVAVTISHGGDFGSCVTVPGTGIILGHGMCRFDPRPGRPNSIGPRKRPLNNTCPTILRLPGRDVALGLRGGRRIVSVVTEMCRRIVDLQASGYEAVSAPRIHLEGQEPILALPSLDPAAVAALRALGHDLSVQSGIGGNAGVAERFAGGTLRGGSNVWTAGVS
ncbi:MAG: gamma-glutamyltransferase [Bryobacterales bacterium]|nr:gamma-glutamyltransferase [Bryobacterales bacterium]